jgi:putative DNA primase/helicase
VDGVIPAGGLQNWRDSLGWEKWAYDTGRQLSVAEVGEIKRKQAEAERVRKEALKAEKLKAADKAERLWANASELLEHPYLRKKGVDACGARSLYGSVVVPGRDAGGKLLTLQFIYADGSKRFLVGGQVTGSFHKIDGDAVRVYIAEGFATAATIHRVSGSVTIVAFNAGNLLQVAKVIAEEYRDSEIIVAADDDWKTIVGGKPHNTGLIKATDAARAIGAKVAVPDFGLNRRERDSDFNDLASYLSDERVRACLEAAAVPAPIVDDEEVSRLAALRPMAYDRERKGAAKRLGVSAGALDKEVKERRAESPTKKPVKVREHWQVEPWPDEVDGAKLLEEIEAILNTYITLSKHAPKTIALWVLYSWVYDAFDISPLLLLRSPEMRCGKTRTLSVLYWLVRRGHLSSNISPSTVYRLIQVHIPTLLLDEGDSFLPEREDLRNILNCGHDRAGAAVDRTDKTGNSLDAGSYSVWAPKVIGAIKGLADTLVDRSIVIVMQRQTPAEKVKRKRFRQRDRQEFVEIRRKALRWAQDNTPALTRLDSEDDAVKVPNELDDRAQDNWRPLLAIAKVVGGEWPKVAEEAASALCAEPSSTRCGSR